MLNTQASNTRGSFQMGWQLKLELGEFQMRVVIDCGNNNNLVAFLS